MLVLSRKAGESIMVGDDIVIRVIEVRGDVVRVGVDAPRSVAVHREEVRRELEAANRAAASPSESAVSSLTQMLRGDDKGKAPQGKAPQGKADPADD